MRLLTRLALLALTVTASPALAQTSAPADPNIGKPTAILVSGPREGDRAPDFSLPWATKDGVGGDPWFGITSSRGKVVVLAFYPKDFTSGCTAEMKTFAEQYDSLFGGDVHVVGISADSLETHVRFAESLKLPFRLLSDPEQKVSGLYGSAGKGGYNRRTVFVIDKKGKVSYTDLQFGALDPKAYSNLRAAVQAARRGA